MENLIVGITFLAFIGLLLVILGWCVWIFLLVRLVLGACKCLEAIAFERNSKGNVHCYTVWLAKQKEAKAEEQQMRSALQRKKE